LNLVKAGTHFATLKKKDILPEHGLAMLNERSSEGFEFIKLSHDEALSYLAKDNFQLQLSGKNWQLASFNGIPLGFVKNLGNRFNNYYPKEWRLRMQDRNSKSLWHGK